MKIARVLFGTTAMGAAEFSADIFWRTGGWSAPDPVFFAEIENKIFLLVSALEAERARREAKVDEIVLLESLAEESQRKNLPASIIFLQKAGVSGVIVPPVIRYSLARELADHFTLEVSSVPFFPARARKNPWEIEEIKKAQRAAESAMRAGMNFLRECAVRDEKLFHPRFRNSAVSSDHLRTVIDEELYQSGYWGIETIAACGAEAADPHAKGRGLLKPREPIVLDIFPRSRQSLFFSDQTRTVFKGEPPADMRRMYETVLAAQELALRRVKPGAAGQAIEAEVRAYFVSQGFPTNTATRPVSGFIHGLGHGVGLEIHEEPHVGREGIFLEAGNVITIEPGLYYHTASEAIPAGGIRIEDIVAVTEDGADNLTNFPKKSADAIIP